MEKSEGGCQELDMGGCQDLDTADVRIWTCARLARMPGAASAIFRARGGVSASCARGNPVERGSTVSADRIEELEARIAALEERLTQLEQA